MIRIDMIRKKQIEREKRVVSIYDSSMSCTHTADTRTLVQEIGSQFCKLLTKFDVLLGSNGSEFIFRIYKSQIPRACIHVEFLPTCHKCSRKNRLRKKSSRWLGHWHE